MRVRHAIPLLLVHACATLTPGDLLPASGVYEMETVGADGGVPTAIPAVRQRILVVREGQTAVQLFLRGDEPVPPVCRVGGDEEACTNVLAGRHIAAVVRKEESGLVAFEAPGGVLVPRVLRPGFTWVAVDEGGCKMSRVIESADSDHVVVRMTSACEGESPRPYGTETWMRGRGLVESQLPTGDRIVWRKKEE